ncbi:MAG: UvrD-helicase domain-containing protein [Pseudomonadota bacterium]
MTPADADAREAALNPRACVCVSAPAGSGKTGLLVHRLLILLARVDHPENVVAITFTRKAAAEMRARVLNALNTAMEDEAGADAHEQALRLAARAVVARDEEQGWGLRGNPARLSIQTIDSFCGELTRQMPVASGAGGAIVPDDDTRPLYAEAIERFLQGTLSEGRSAARRDVERLLLHLDNRWESAAELLEALLQRREQWQPLLGVGGLVDEQQSVLRDAVNQVASYRLAQLRSALQPVLEDLEGLCHWRHEQVPEFPRFLAASEDPQLWRSLVELLLTKSGAWRRTVNRNQGFPPGKGEAGERKATLLELIQELQAADRDETLRRALTDVLLLPDTDSRDEHWEILAALSRLLPRLAAELLLVFRERGVVDHGQVALAALAALGSDEAPSDLALRLDHRIEHLLVDEFQDTSSLQFELLRRLTRGWMEHNAENPSAPRTLLIVGDPMQSIYGFREANVGLFIRARDHGIGDLRLQSLELRVNFRSSAKLVAWSNATFAAAFPDRDDPELGGVSFAPASAAQQGGVAPEFRLFSSEDGSAAGAAEVQALCDAVETELRSRSDSTLAILGRSRSQLRFFIAELRARGIEHLARDVDLLGGRPLIRDLLSLVSVLLDRTDRYAWLALLRTPALAVNNRELFFMAQNAPTAAMLEHALEDTSGEARRSLSATAFDRLVQLRDVLNWADRFQDRLALRVWVEESWLRLGGAAIIKADDEADDAEQFFRLLEGLELDRGTPTIRDIEEALATLYASPGDEGARLQVMTLHKAKGLEFDAVFIPALGKATRHDQKPLLLWEELALPEQESTVLMDIRAATGDGSSRRLYEFLRAQRAHKQDLEATRLFYVGCTRAASRLWLSATLPWSSRESRPGVPAKGSLLSKLWSEVDTLPVEIVERLDEEAQAYVPYRRLAELPGSMGDNAVKPPGPLSATSAPERDAAIVGSAENRRARALGTAVHRVLESLIYRGELPQTCDERMRRLLHMALLESAADRPALDELCRAGEANLNRALEDPWLRWSLSPSRARRSAELPLTAVTDDGVRSLVLDYVFQDESTREFWIVDYKTAEPRPDETPEAFAVVQEERYRAQIEAYRRALRATGAAPVRCALYFTALARHHEVPEHAPAP